MTCKQDLKSGHDSKIITDGVYKTIQSHQHNIIGSSIVVNDALHAEFQQKMIAMLKTQLDVSQDDFIIDQMCRIKEVIGDLEKKEAFLSDIAEEIDGLNHYKSHRTEEVNAGVIRLEQQSRQECLRLNELARKNCINTYKMSLQRTKNESDRKMAIIEQSSTNFAASCMSRAQVTSQKRYNELKKQLDLAIIDYEGLSTIIETLEEKNFSLIRGNLSVDWNQMFFEGEIPDDYLPDSKAHESKPICVEKCQNQNYQTLV